MNDVPNDEILTIKELATYLKMVKKTIYRFVSEEKFLGSRLGQIVASLKLK